MTVTRHTPIEQLPEVLMVEEMCAWLGIGKSKGYDMVRREEIESIKIGRLVRVPRSALIALLQKGVSR